MGVRSVDIHNNVYYGDTSFEINQHCNDENKRIFINNLMFNLPESLPQTIVGRNEEIDDIYRILTTKTEKNRRIALTGLGGAGKTYLALHCALTWCSEEKFNSSALIHCESKTTFENSFNELAIKLHISTQQSMLEIIKEIIKTYKNKKILFILDDIHSCEIASDLFSSQSSKKYVYILATSQNIELSNTFNCYPLSKLNPEESTELLTDIIKNKNLKDDILGKVIDFCDGLPLALTQAAACIKDKITYQPENQWNKCIQDYEGQLNEPLPDDFNIINRNNVCNTIKINIDKLKMDGSKRLLIFLMYLDPTEIELDMLRCIFGTDTENCFRELKKYSLIYDNHNAEHLIFGIPRILQEVCKLVLKLTDSDVLSLMIAISSNIKYYLTHWDYVTNNFSKYAIDIKNVLDNAKPEDVILICKNIFYNSTISDKIVSTLKDAGCINVDYKTWPDLVIASAIGFYNKDVTNTVLSKIGSTCDHNMNICVEDGITPLHAACGARGGHVVNSLLGMIVSCNIATDNGVKPIHIACTAGKKFDVECLLAKDANVNEIGPNKNTPLHLAVRKLNWYLVPILCKYGAEINHQNDEGNTPLHVSAKIPYDKFRTKATINELFAAGADATIRNNDNYTPINVAEANPSSEKIAKYIRHPQRPGRLHLPNFCVLL